MITSTPTNIHTRVAWSSLNNCDDTSKVILLHWKLLFSSFLFLGRDWLPISFPLRDPGNEVNWLHVGSNLVPGLTLDWLIIINYLQPWKRNEIYVDNWERTIIIEENYVFMAATDTLERTKVTGTNNNLLVGKKRAKKNSSFSIWQWCLLLPDIHQQEIPAALTVPEITKTMAILNTIFTDIC